MENQKVYLKNYNKNGNSKSIFKKRIRLEIQKVKIIIKIEI